MTEPLSENPHLRDGWHLFPTPEGPWMLVSPDQRFVRLRIEPPLAERLAARLAGGREGAEDASLSPLLEQFGRQGLLAPAPARRGLRERRVVVRGDGPVAEEVARLFREEGVGRVDRISGKEPPAVTDLVVACAGWLPDADWLRLDAWCAEWSIAWHGCYTEGLRFYLGPLVIPGRTAGYTDVRARRLAAAHFPAELQACWRYLDSGKGVPPVPWPGAGGVAAIAGALAADALAWLSGEPVPNEGYQLAFDPAKWEWRRHPVLPVPRDLMREPVP